MLRNTHAIATSGDYRDLSIFELYEVLQTAIALCMPDIKDILFIFEEKIAALIGDRSVQAKRKRFVAHIIRGMKVIERNMYLNEGQIQKTNNYLHKAKQGLLLSLEEDMATILFFSTILPNEIWLKVIKYLGKDVNRLARVSRYFRSIVSDEKKHQEVKKDYSMPMLTKVSPSRAFALKPETLITFKDDIVAFVDDQYHRGQVEVGRFDHDGIFEKMASFRVPYDFNNHHITRLVKLPGSLQLATLECSEYRLSIVRIWQWQAGEVTQKDEIKLPSYVSEFAVTANASMIVYIGAHTIFFWDIKKKACVKEITGHDMIVSSSGKIITVSYSSADKKSTIAIWDAEANLLHEITLEKKRRITKLAELAENRLLALDDMKEGLFVWDLDSYELLIQFDCPGKPHRRYKAGRKLSEIPETVISLPDGKIALIAGGQIAVIDVLTRKMFFSTNAHPYACLNKDGDIVTAEYGPQSSYLKILYFYDNKSLRSDSQFIRSSPSFMREAVKAGCVSLVKYAVACGANLEAKVCEEKYTALEAAIQGGRLEIVEYLIEQGANLASVDQNERGLIFWLKKSYFYFNEDVIRICQLLLNEGAGIKGALPFDPTRYFYNTIMIFNLKDCLFLGATIEGKPVTRKIRCFEHAITNLDELESRLNEAMLARDMNYFIKTRNILVSYLAQYPKDETLKKALGLVASFSNRFSLTLRCLFFAADHKRLEALAHAKMPTELQDSIKQIKPSPNTP